MESSSSNSEEKELQQMQLEERQSHSKCMAWFKELKSHLGNLYKFSELERDDFHGHDLKTCFDVLRPQFREFFDSKEANALDFQNKCWQKNFKDYTRCEPETYRHNLLGYLNELDKLIDERVLNTENYG
ncbi:hypothetical protein Tco_1141614 [Tanacetum coccineum]